MLRGCGTRLCRHVGSRGEVRPLFYHLILVLLKQGLSVNLKLTVLSRPDGQQAPRLRILLLPVLGL